MNRSKRLSSMSTVASIGGENGSVNIFAIFLIAVAFCAGAAVQHATNFYSGLSQGAADFVNDFMWFLRDIPGATTEWPPANFPEEYCRTKKAVTASSNLREYMLDNWKIAEPYTLLAGDEQGIKFAITAGDHRQMATFPCQAYHVFSASKLITASAIGHAVVVSDNQLQWDTKASDLFDWWEKDGPYADLTLERFLSQTAGVDFNNIVIKDPSKWQDFNEHGDHMPDPMYAAPYIFKNAMNEKNARNKYFAYDEGNFVIAAAMAMRATDSKSWASFIDKYWGQPLGLIQQPMARKWLLDKVYPMSAIKQQDHTWAQSRTYGFVNTTQGFRHAPGGFENHLQMSPGGNFIMSPTAYSIFLTKYTSGEYHCDKKKLTKIVADTSDPVKNAGAFSWFKDSKYGLGQHVVQDHYPIARQGAYRELTHSCSAKGTLPVQGETGTGKKFWFYVGRYGDKDVSQGNCSKNAIPTHRTGNWGSCDIKNMLHPELGIVHKISEWMEENGRKIKPIPADKLCQPRKPQIGCCHGCQYASNAPDTAADISPRCPNRHEL